MMASSDHLTTVDPWNLRPAYFLDPWFNDALSRDTETLTRALQMSLSSSSTSAAAATPSDSNTNNSSSDTTTTTLTPDVVSPSFLIPTPGFSPATAAFGSNSFENVARGVEVPKQRQRKGGVPGVSSGKVAKRKSRATNRSQTTFITADAANFRQMVQQVTGSRLGHSPMTNIGQILRPEPHRPGNRFPCPSNGSGDMLAATAAASIAGCLPTLDTSAFLLDRHRNQDQQQQQGVEMVGQGSVDVVGSPLLLPVALAEEFEPFGRFPTLESWNSM